jgi:single-strand DNA-binding protein
MYLNAVTIVGFVGADPEQRQAKESGAKFTVFSVATRRSWKNAQDEWASKTKWHRVAIFRPRLSEYVLESIRKGAHVLIEGSLISLDLRPGERQGQESPRDQPHLVDDSRRCSAQARPRRTGSGRRDGGAGRTSRIGRRGRLLEGHSLEKCPSNRRGTFFAGLNTDHER